MLITGGDKRDRTVDLLHAMQALSQLSYTPTLLSVRTFIQYAFVLTDESLLVEYLIGVQALSYNST